MLKNLQRAQPDQQSDGKSKTIEPQPPHTFFDRPKHTLSSYSTVARGALEICTKPFPTHFLAAPRGKLNIFHCCCDIDPRIFNRQNSLNNTAATGNIPFF